MGQIPNSKRRPDEHILRALNKIRKTSTAEEITELLNRDLHSCVTGDSEVVRRTQMFLKRAPMIQCAYRMRIHDRAQQMNEIASATMKLLLQKD